MRTFKLIQAISALAMVLAISLAVPSGALAHRHNHSARHSSHHRRHRRHHRSHHTRLPSSTTAAPSSTTTAPSSTTTAPSFTAAASDSTAAAAASFSPAVITGTAYYVSPSGSDSNSGTTAAQAWKTVARVDKASVTLKPGDGVLFQGGATFADDALMPGWGAALAGTSASPIVFGSYGQGRASIPQGVWVKDASYLVFQNFDLGPKSGLSGTGNNDTVQGCVIHDLTPGLVPAGSAEVGINVIGSQWLIQGNTINHTGDSGLLLRGDHMLVTGNVIGNTGLDPLDNWGTHGIYLKADNSTVTGNTIYNFQNDGISIRYRNSVIANNTIENGEIGLAWFQYDATAGTSHWTNNTITGDTVAGIYVSAWDTAGGNTRESFVISGNSIAKPANRRSYWESMNLKPTSGSYAVSNNTIG